MPLTYTKERPDGDAFQVIRRMSEYAHRRLIEAGVTFEVLYVRGGLKLNGYRAAATVRVTSLEQRAAGCADVRIKIDDGDEDGRGGWSSWDKKRRQAIVDHELTHVLVKRDKEGEIARDDLGRPKLSLRLHDHQIGIFEEVIDRHKEHAVDAQVVARMVARVKQLEFDWSAAEAMAEGSAEPVEVV